MFPLLIPMLSRRVLIAATTSVAALILASLFLYQVQAQPLAAISKSGRHISVSPGSVSLSAHAATAVPAVTAIKAPMLEVHIANNGFVLLRGARVISISGQTIHVGLTWESVGLTLAIQTNSSTKLLTTKGEKGTLADIQVGDFLTVTGILNGNGIEPTIDAELVHKK